MAKDKELWRGAGLWLDFRNISDEDREKVERRLDEIGELNAQIIFLEKIKATYEHSLNAIFEDLEKLARKRRHEWVVIKERSSESAAAHARDPVDEVTRRGNRFELWVKEKLKYLNKMRIIESKASAGQPGATSSTAAKTIASKELGKITPLTAAQRVWVFYFLLETAGMNADELQKTDIARFIVAATGSEPGKVYDHVTEPEQKTPAATHRDLTAVRSWFSKLKMADMVKKVDRERKNYEG